MIFKGEFADIHNRVLALRFFTTDGGTEEVPVTMGAAPFTTSMKEGNTLYTPALYEAATAQLIVGEYLFDLYTGEAQGVRVELTEGNTLLWTGYVEPTIYKQGFREARETINIDCSCALASLQYLKHQRGPAVWTFAELLAETIGRARAYTYFYISNNIHISNQATIDPLSSLVISGDNFFSRRRDARQTDDDLAWTCKEVLEEVCRYLGVTAVAYRDSVLLLDYDALKEGNTNFYCYDIAERCLLGEFDLEEILMAPTLHIDGSSHAAADASLSLEKVYNKVEVTDSFYTMEEITVDPFAIESIENVTLDTDPLGVSGEDGASLTPQAGALLDTRPLRFSSDDKEPSNVIRFFDSVWSEKEGEWKLNLVCVRYVTNDNVQLKRYTVTGGVPTSVNRPTGLPHPYPGLTYSETKNLTGALLAQFYVQPLNCEFNHKSMLPTDMKAVVQNRSWVNKLIKSLREQGRDTLLISGEHEGQTLYTWEGLWFEGVFPSIWYPETTLRHWPELLDDVQKAAARRFSITSIDPTNYICLFNPVANHINPDNESYDKLPFVTIGSQQLGGGLIGGSDAYLVISGELIWHYDQTKGGGVDKGYRENPYPLPSGQIDSVGRKENLDRNYMYIPHNECWTYAWLRLDGRAWNGSEWVEDPENRVFFKLWYFEADDDNDKRNVPNSVAKAIPFRNTINYTMGLGKVSGLAIPLPPDGALLEQTPQFGLCKPHDPKMWYRQDEGEHFYTFDRVFIKDLKLTVAVGNALYENTDSDTTFTNEIEDANAVELPAVKLRITTYDSKKFSYSNVGVRQQNGRTRFLSRFINRALHERELTWQFDNGEYSTALQGLSAEEHLVFKYVEQYRRPARALNLTIHGAGLSPAAVLTNKTLSDDCKMVPAVIRRDYRFDTATVKLVEKF